MNDTVLQIIANWSKIEIMLIIFLIVLISMVIAYGYCLCFKTKNITVEVKQYVLFKIKTFCSFKQMYV